MRIFLSASAAKASGSPKHEMRVTAVRSPNIQASSIEVDHSPMHLAVIQPKLELDPCGEDLRIPRRPLTRQNDFDVSIGMSLRTPTIVPPSFGKVHPCFFDRGDDVEVACAATQISRNGFLAFVLS